MPNRHSSCWRGCALLLFGLLLLTGCGEPTKKIVLLINTENAFWNATRAGVKEAATDLKFGDAKYEAYVDSNVGQAKGQIEKLTSYLARKDIVAVGISPYDAKNDAMADVLKKLKDKGVVIICFDSDLPPEKQNLRDFYVGTDNIKAGKVLGTAAVNLKPDGAPYVQFVGTDAQQNAIQRMDGFTSALNDKFVQKDRMLDAEKKETAIGNVTTAMSKYPEVSLLVGIWAYNGPAIAEAIKNDRAKYTALTFDADEAAIDHMERGNLDAMLVQNPFMMGYLTVNAAYAKLNKDEKTIKEIFPKLGEPNGNIRDTGLKLIVPVKGSPLQEEQFKSFNTEDSKLEFMRLPAFQDWLKKYNLKSS
jgi:ribose transport system substrate-binding protein